MMEFKSQCLYDKNHIMAHVVKVLTDMTSEWEMESDMAIDSETFLGADLGFKSLDFVRFVSVIQNTYNRKVLPFQDLLLSNNGVIDDVRVSALVDFLHYHVND